MGSPGDMKHGKSVTGTAGGGDGRRRGTVSLVLLMAPHQP